MLPLSRLLLVAVLTTSSVATTLLAAEKEVIELEDVSDEEKVRWARATKVPVVEAIKTATMRMPGQVIEASLHSIRGRLLYEVEVVTHDGKVIELYVDPQTGKLVESGDKR
jgi:uncharacterized membrane protein YkoI